MVNASLFLAFTFRRLVEVTRHGISFFVLRSPDSRFGKLRRPLANMFKSSARIDVVVISGKWRIIPGKTPMCLTVRSVEPVPNFCCPIKARTFSNQPTTAAKYICNVPTHLQKCRRQLLLATLLFVLDLASGSGMQVRGVILISHLFFFNLVLTPGKYKGKPFLVFLHFHSTHHSLSRSLPTQSFFAHLPCIPVESALHSLSIVDKHHP